MIINMIGQLFDMSLKSFMSLKHLIQIFHILKCGFMMKILKR